MLVKNNSSNLNDSVKLPYGKLLSFCIRKEYSYEEVELFFQKLKFPIDKNTYIYTKTYSFLKDEFDLIENNIEDIIALRYGFGNEKIFIEIMSFLSHHSISMEDTIERISERYGIDLSLYQRHLSCLYDVSNFSLLDWYGFLKWLFYRGDPLYEVISKARFSTKEKILADMGYWENNKNQKKYILDMILNDFYEALKNKDKKLAATNANLYISLQKQFEEAIENDIEELFKRIKIRSEQYRYATPEDCPGVMESLEPEKTSE